ncbi:hypothetical protein K504DRAFT_97959 [Pleomassaria siparia CBS 279.74]|uniref:DUF7896 domain-containing protein n=1 Tax=Pleomassaria siparia CBS 279.74 TaxID=1314801 RepID=A0A6G1JY19_9PLEO|nr:hypothetical protein K504DRAFT_97959 [Pleomassaria siparia CBS 279.74]
MSTMLPNTDTTYLHMLEQAKQDLWSRNAHLSQQQRQQLWLQAASGNVFDPNHATPSMVSQTPRSMAFNTCSTQLPTQDLGSMDRTRSAPVIPLGRSIPATHNNLLERSNTTTPLWQPTPDNSAREYTFVSDASVRTQSMLQSIDETSPFTNDGLVEYTPGDYVTTCIDPSSSPSMSIAHNTDSRQLHVQLTPNAQWSQPVDGSISPSTPSTIALMTPVTQSSNGMSRQSSFNPPFLDHVSMLRAYSDSSSICPPLLVEDGSSSYHVPKSISACADTSPFFDFTGSPSEDFFLHAHVSSSASALESSEQQHKSYLVEDMRRSASASSESNASNASLHSATSRQFRREREINASAASRKIAPKATERNDEIRSASSTDQMVRIRSSDGSSKDVAVITKTPYIRPQHPKIMCQYCNERPNGFRGTHELDRHIARAHATTRKAFVCVDASENKKFLANCKHCRNGKQYGAYYNAAAHLRRAHFHPRRRGPKSKRDEKRGGIGGGDHPPMEILKQHWIKEIEVGMPKHASASPSESASDDAEGAANNYETSSMHVSYPQVAHDVPNQFDPSRFDMSMYMNPSEPVFDPAMQFPVYPDMNSSINDPNAFQFDAYMNQ